MSVSVRQRLDALQVTSTKAFRGMTVVSLAAPAVGPQLTLLHGPEARVAERDHDGTIAALHVTNHSHLPLLLLTGELFRGGKQDRAVNLTTLIRPQTTQQVTTSCVERDRWRYVAQLGEHFSGGRTTSPWHLRTAASIRACESRTVRGVADAGQEAVWDEISEFLREREVRSLTASLHDAFDRMDMDTALGAWSPAADDVGAMFFLGERLVGLEVFGRPEAWRAAHRRILAGLHLDAPDSERLPSFPAMNLDLLRRMTRHIPLHRVPGQGLGAELTGSDEAVHLAAATVPSDAEGAEGAEDVVHLRIGVVRHPDHSGRRRPIWRRGGHRADVVPPDEADGYPLESYGFEEGVEPDHDPATRVPAAVAQAAASPPSKAGLVNELDIRIGRSVAALRRPPTGRINGWFLAVPISDYEKLLVGVRSVARLPPLPHALGGRLALWLGSDEESVRWIRGALLELGVPPDRTAKGDSRSVMLNRLPTWLEVCQRTERGVHLRLTPEEREPPRSA